MRCGCGGCDHRRGGGSLHAGGGTAPALQLGDAGVGSDQALTQLVVLLREATELDDDLVEEIVDLVLVVALAELGRLEALVDDIFGRESHARHLDTFWSG